MRKKVPSGLSLYLDSVRFVAAIVVVLHHTWPLVFPSFPLPWPGHSAVVVFFVLSGFVITHAAQPEIGLRNYIHHRIARILPVVIVAMLLSIALSSLAGTQEIPNGGPMIFDWQSIRLNVLFLGQSWMNILPSFNPPFWSLNYEVWYYIIFGAFVYAPNKIFAVLATLIAGPKILLLMPVWLLGVGLYKFMPSWRPATAWWVFWCTCLAGLAYIWFDTAVHIREYMKVVWPIPMSYTQGSGLFVGDFLLGLIVVANFAAVAALDMKGLSRADQAIRYLSSFTFSIYVFHIPLAIFLWNGLRIHQPLYFYSFLFGLIFCLAQLSERRTRFYRSLLLWSPAPKAII